MAQTDAAVALVHTRGGDESVLLMRRTVRESDPWSGHWSFPGGRIDPGDPSPLDAALRELEEECGIRLAPPDLETALPAMAARRREGRFLTVAPFVFRVAAQLPTRLAPEEAEESFWIPLRVLLDPARHRLRPVPGMPPELHYPAIEMNHVPLWGFTYRLITEWLGLLPGDGRATAGFAVARDLLAWLLQNGVPLRQDWAGGRACVGGAIPVAEVHAFLSQPWGSVPPVNVVEVRPETIRVVGLAFEEYFIHTRG